MEDDIDYRVKQWQPPSRPEWVQRINEEGSYLDIKSVVPLDEDSLISCAKRNTGLSDFGADDWYEPFKFFIKGVDDEAELNLMGRLMTRADLLMHLEARLRVEDTFKRHPEIDVQELSPPIMIVGSGRSGTSAIQNLLSYDPDNGTTLQWECMYPVPAPEAADYRSDPRIAIADKRITLGYRVTPELMSMHEYGGEIPTELNYLETLSFLGASRLNLYGVTPSFQAYIAKLSHVPKLRYAKRVLKLLQWKNPRRRWILKLPDTMNFLPDLFKVFPDLELVWMHRDPIKTVSSFVSLVGTLFWVRSDKRLDPKVYAHLSNPAGLATLFNSVIDLIDQGRIPAKQIHHVQYVDFVGSPLDTVEALYKEIGIAITDQARAAMDNYLRQHPRENRPPHQYGMGAGERLSDERKLFERYQTLFKVPTEI